MPHDGKVCISGWIVSDPDGDKLTFGTMGSGTFDPATRTFCKTVSAPGQYTMKLAVSDPCGATATTELTFEVLANDPPSVAILTQPVSICQKDTVCLDLAVTDEDTASLSYQTSLGFFEDHSVCFVADSPGVYKVIVTVTDECGQKGKDTAYVEVHANGRPEISGPVEDTVTLCSDTRACVGPFVITDPEGDSVTISVSGGATFDPASSDVCFDAPQSGDYQFTLTASDECGSTERTVKVHVHSNEPPTWSQVLDTSVVACAPGDSVCFEFSATDPDGDSITYDVRPLIDARRRQAGLTSCPLATYCFTPQAEGLYRFEVQASDSCHAPIVDTALVWVTFNRPPQIAFSLPDTTLWVCDADTVLCFDVSATDADGDPVTVREILNPGTFNEETGKVCFNPDDICFDHPMTTDTTICLVFGASDACGPEIVDSLCIQIVLNRAPMVRLPADQTVALCGPGQICLPGAAATDPDGDALQIAVSHGGSYESGLLCFDAPEPGLYQVELCATDPCGHTTCDTMAVQVSFNSAPTVVFGPDPTVSLCAPGQVCVEAPLVSDPDGDIPYLQIEGAVQQGEELCFNAAGAGTYTIVFLATDSCGARSADTLVVKVEMNAAPRVLIRAAKPLTLCDIDTTLCYGVMVSDIDGSPITSVRLVKTDTHFWSLNDQNLCLDASVALAGRTEGTFQAIVEATDACGLKGRDTLTVHLKANQPPFARLPQDSAALLCEPGQICVGPVEYGDPENAPLDLQIQGGVLVGNQICLNVGRDTLALLVLTVRDTCGLVAADTMRLDARINRPPAVVLPPDTTVVACVVEDICLGPVSITDADPGDSLTVTISGGARLEGDRLCFRPAADGDYTFVVTAVDRCGVRDADSITVHLEKNDPPALVFSSPDTSITLCHSDTNLCFRVIATDPDGEDLDIQEVLVPGFFDPSTGIFCFNPDSVCFHSPLTMDTTICVVFRVTDGCGATVTDSLCIEVRVNRAPVIHFSSSDTTLFVCNPDTLLCFGITATDEDGDSVVIREILNPGEYFPELGTFCFKPNSVCYPNQPCSAPPTCVVFEAEDECGHITRDSLCIDVFANVPPVVLAPDSISTRLCRPGETICISPVTGTDVEDGALMVSAPGATYDPRTQSLCFTADTAGLYRFTASVVDACAARDTELITVLVVANQPPVVQLPADTALFLCGPDTVCFNAAVLDPGDTWTVTQVQGPAYFDQVNGRLCVAILTPGSTITAGLTVADACGATASDQIVITPTFNRPPQVSLPGDFAVRVCEPGPYCFGPVQISDPDFNLAGAPVVSGGTYDAGSAKICVDVQSSARHTVVVSVTDSCGRTAADTVVVDATLNRPPVTSFSSPDTSLYLCTPDTLLCFRFSATDPDGGLVLLGEILNPGTFDPLTGEFCFNPSDICFGEPGTYKCSGKRYEYDTSICLIFSATDTCGAEVWDTLCVHVTANQPPVVIAPADTSIVACSSEPLCLNPFVITDPNGSEDPLSVVSSGPAHTFDPATGRLCFAATPGTYRFLVTATDRCGETASDSVNVVVEANRPPVVTLPADFSTLACSGQEVCVSVTASDPDPGDVPVITPVSAGTRYDQASSSLCFTPQASGDYLVIAGATDRCGLADLDTVLITVTQNRAPAWTSVPEIDTFFCAPPGSICFSVRAQDPDGQTLVYAKLEGPGTIDSQTGQICFNPGSATALFSFVVTASDPCGATVKDTAHVNVHINRPPVLAAVRDTLVSLCQAAPVCFPPISATDPDNNTITYTLLSGSGTLSGNVYCFTPDTSGLYRAIVKASDPCGAADTVTFFASVRLNRPPILHLPQPPAQFLCSSGELCISGISATDDDGGPVTIVKTAGPGTFTPATGQVCFTPASAGTYTFDFRATDTCGAQATGRMTVTVQINRAPTLDVPAQVAGCRDSLICIPVGAIDPDISNRLTITQVSGPTGTFSPSPLSGPAPLSGEWCWKAQAAGSYFVVFRAVDSCGSAVVDTTRIDVSEFCDTLCFAASIPTICPDADHPDRWLFQGRTHAFPILVTPSRAVGAFDFLIGYDASALTVQSVARGADISAWEFFTYRILDPNTECSGLCPSGLLRIVGIADINNGVPIKDPSQTQPSSQPREYARITFQVSNDRTLAGQFVPVKFWWTDCGDNTFSSPQGDLYVSNLVDPDTCVDTGAKEPIEACATFQDGGGCIPRAADIDDRGDLNLNGIGYEIADAVLYSNYFILGPQVFDRDPTRQASQVAASDVNGDGQVLTVADLVFLIRIILGVEQPIDPGAGRMPSPGAATLRWDYDGDQANLNFESSVAAGALALEARIQRAPSDVELSDAARGAGMELKWHAEGDRLRILVYSMNGSSLPPGSQTVITVRGTRPETISSQASDEAGRVLAVSQRASATLPVAFDLDPNYPNPFNPETEIRFTLHLPATVSLCIYNVLGQEVARLIDEHPLAAGPYQYRWLARDQRGASLTSGVYLYRLTADGYSESRKMLLLR